MEPSSLKRFVLEDMQRFFNEYELPPTGTTVGQPWSKERVALELGKMQLCVVDPSLVECKVMDTLEEMNANPPVRRQCWLVAIDGDYGLLFDPVANDFALAGNSAEHGWATFGIRGDAVTTFLAR